MSTKMSVSVSSQKEDGYDDFESAVAYQIAGINGPAFTTDATPEELWDAYLSGIPADRRQHYTCHSCRRFIQTYGGLKLIDKDGTATPAIWKMDAPEFFAESVGNLNRLLIRSKVNGVFLSSSAMWGTPEVGGWSHLAGRPSVRPYSGKTKSASETIAEKKEDYGILSRSLSEYSDQAIAQALRVLRADTLDRSEKTLGVAEWFAKLQSSIAANPGRKSALIWLAVATAPTGFCHIRSTMISTLLDDIVAGLEYDEIARRWSSKMHPLRYQRPTAAPAAGTIEQAEKLVEKLGVARSLNRRFATLADVLSKIWTPPVLMDKPEKSGGVFDHLRKDKKTVDAVDLPTVPMTWEKFHRTILPAAMSMEIHVPSHGGFYGLVTAVDPDAPAIIQWDGLEGHPRNPVSWYFYNGGSAASRWNLSAGWSKVTSAFYGPYRWQEPTKFTHQGHHVFFSIDGCWDTQDDNRGLALFPEILKSEFHGIRSVIEAHSKSGGIEQAEGGNANGLSFGKGSPVTIRVKAPEGSAVYTIDRLD